MNPHFAAADTEQPKTGGLNRVWAWIVRVPETQPRNERAARFAAAVSAALFVAASLIGLGAFFFPQPNLSIPAFLIAAGLFLGAWLINRSGNYEAAGWLTIFTFLALPFANLLTGSLSTASVVLSAAISAAGTLLIAFLYLLVYDNRQPRATQDGSAPAASAQPESAAEVDELRKTIARLEHDLKDLGIELQATVDEYERVNTEVEEAKEEAERANHAKSAFLASMSHELRTPLNAIINLTKFVAEGDLGEISDAQREALQGVVGSGKHLLNLINDILDMSKIESGSLNLFIEDHVNLAEILSSVEATGKGLLVDKPVVLSLDMDENLPLIRGDRQRITQILLNLMSNASKFTPQGSITMRAWQTEDEVVMSVQDTGSGIAETDHQFVYEAFKQTNTGLRTAGGTGLGIPISKNLAEAHGGRLWFESEPGKGSTFFVALPVKSKDLVPMFSASQEQP